MRPKVDTFLDAVSPFILLCIIQFHREEMSFGDGEVRRSVDLGQQGVALGSAAIDHLSAMVNREIVMSQSVDAVSPAARVFKEQARGTIGAQAAGVDQQAVQLDPFMSVRMVDLTAASPEQQLPSTSGAFFHPDRAKMLQSAMNDRGRTDSSVKILLTEEQRSISRTPVMKMQLWLVTRRILSCRR
jgi:hypothetical protein